MAACRRIDLTPVAAARTAHAVPMRACAEETNLHPQWLGLLVSAALQAISQHRISGAVQRHRMTDAGMRLDRAGGGAASGEVERLPGMALLIPASGRD